MVLNGLGIQCKLLCSVSSRCDLIFFDTVARVTIAITYMEVLLWNTGIIRRTTSSMGMPRPFLSGVLVAGYSTQSKHQYCCCLHAGAGGGTTRLPQCASNRLRTHFAASKYKRYNSAEHIRNFNVNGGLTSAVRGLKIFSGSDPGIISTSSAQ